MLPKLDWDAFVKTATKVRSRGFVTEPLHLHHCVQCVRHCIYSRAMSGVYSQVHMWICAYLDFEASQECVRARVQRLVTSSV